MTNCDWCSAGIGLFGVLVGAGISWWIESRLRKSDEESRFLNALTALKTEVDLNIRLKQTEKDEKHINYSTSAWLDFRPYYNRLVPGVKEDLAGAYANISRHAAALQVEMIRANVGQALVQLSEEAVAKFKRALAVENWIIG